MDFRLLNGKLRFSANDGTGLRTANGVTVISGDGKWHHVAAVYDASAGQLRVYLDYVLEGTATTAYSAVVGNTNDLWLGQQNNGGAKFDGDIDFIRFSYGALATTNFIQASTSLSNFSPTNGASFVSSSTPAGFTVGSSVGVPATNITVTVNG
ncbi:MAG: Laminin domain protein, partial [Pedosphaera sp.]|nr:Laminin domain protein [Pedosphaera sp.]